MKKWKYQWEKNCRKGNIYMIIPEKQGLAMGLSLVRWCYDYFGKGGNYIYKNTSVSVSNC